MDSSTKALIVKKFKDAELDLDVGRHWIDETVVIRVSGTVERHEDQWIAPTISIPLIPTVAFFWDHLGVGKDAAMRVLREALTEAMRATYGAGSLATAVAGQPHYTNRFLLGLDTCIRY